MSIERKTYVEVLHNDAAMPEEIKRADLPLTVETVEGEIWEIDGTEYVVFERDIFDEIIDAKCVEYKRTIEVDLDIEQDADEIVLNVG